MVASSYIARKLDINGIVQGVGFRPFIYQLAARYRIKGEVANTSAGVTVHIEGLAEDVDAFRRELSEKGPPLARVTDIAEQPEPVAGYSAFSITKSRRQATRSTLISPDTCVCDACLQELFDPADRRYRYPFINCTHCGPRYTIIDDIPYDRPNTSMKSFTMCPQCQAEYDDPGNRRFHAQPNACAACGPRVSLYTKTGTRMPSANPIEKVAALLRQGAIVAIKGLGGFHLAADAVNSRAVAVLRQRKQRAEKPLALMSYDVDSVRQYAVVHSAERSLLVSARRPIVILAKKTPNPIAAEVAPRHRNFGVLLPYTPLHYLILSHGFTALVMTSGNQSEEPIAIDNREALERLAHIADYFLLHDRPIYLRCDDSIARISCGAPRLIRRSRGYVPVPVFLKKEVPPILACGAELKNTVCLTKANRAFLSQHIGDLENLAAYEFFQHTIAHLKRILDIEPQICAHDLHPDYLSTRYAGEQTDLPKIAVQHHHAHIASCMAESQLEGPVIGLALDGTGYGTDGTIWGGEVLIADTHGFQRAAHLAPVAMPGGEAAIREPWRMALSYLYDAFGNDFQNLDLPLLGRLGSAKIAQVLQMIAKKVNSPVTSSLGRLFDGIASLADVRQQVCYEGQAAMELEMIAARTPQGAYNFQWSPENEPVVALAPIVRGVVRDLQEGLGPAQISAKFHLTLIRLFAGLCAVIRKETGLRRVVLSGGVFQNAILLNGLSRALAGKKFEVYTHRQVPPNDGGVCLGQAVVAAAQA